MSMATAFGQGIQNGNGNGNGGGNNGNGQGNTLDKAVHETLTHNQASRGIGGGSGISYHGGALLVNGVHVYYIWYGNWAGNTATSILPVLASNIGGSSYFNIN